MAGTMLELWDRYRATWVYGTVDFVEDEALRAELRRALATTGPVYLRGVVFDAEVPPVPVVWLGLRRDDVGMLCIVGGDAAQDPGVAPSNLLGGGTARDAASVPVPEPKVETWRDREPLFW